VLKELLLLKRQSITIAKVMLFLLASAFSSISAQAMQVAILNMVGDEKGEFTQLLRTEARRNSPEISLIDEDQTAVALRGAGYSGSLNLSRDEARALGLSLGCDLFVIGKVLLARRIDSADKFYFESFAAMFLIDTRSGRLLKFLFADSKADQEKEARAQLIASLNAHWQVFKEVIKDANVSAQKVSESSQSLTSQEEVIDLDHAPSGLAAPVFYQRLKPPYNDQAKLAAITATVELDVVFQADGRVGKVEIVRWAGFGLDESAVATVRQLRFKPAELNGRKVSVRARVQYNFR